MSLRRKSCSACYRARRKCDLGIPSCGRCRKNDKICLYVYPQPRAPAAANDSGNKSSVEAPPEEIARSTEAPQWQQRFTSNTDLELGPHEMEEFMSMIIPDFLGPLGELQPVSGKTKSWQWVIDQLKSYPREFSQHAGTTFIHKELFQDTLPNPIRAAFGLSTACVDMNELNQPVIFRILDVEVQELLKPSDGALLENLARLQAAVMYQVIRLFRGGLKQRVTAERQKSLLLEQARQLLQQADAEFRGADLSWENWVLTESVRRTVMLSFLVYGVYSVFKDGACPEYPAMKVLPVSSRLASWGSKAAYLQYSNRDETIKYDAFIGNWVTSPLRTLDPFEKLILVACKGIDTVEAFCNPSLFEHHNGQVIPS